MRWRRRRKVGTRRWRRSCCTSSWTPARRSPLPPTCSPATTSSPPTSPSRWHGCTASWTLCSRTWSSSSSSTPPAWTPSWPSARRCWRRGRRRTMPTPPMRRRTTPTWASHPSCSLRAPLVPMEGTARHPPAMAAPHPPATAAPPGPRRPATVSSSSSNDLLLLDLLLAESRQGISRTNSTCSCGPHWTATLARAASHTHSKTHTQQTYRLPRQCLAPH
mmetsp:Transcript_17485/g.52458  ORF Transcript_17485/g.52458 Transcript_17485/m.52458 type:complete len:219 (-) Transcript_17485:335-991(-)